MNDYLIKTLAYDKQIRAYAIDATEVVRQAQERHDTWSASSAALGRTMVGSLLLSAASFKGEGELSVIVDGDGPAGKIVVEATYDGTVKGYIANPHVHLPLNEFGKIDVKGAVGTHGTLTVTKDLGLKQPFSGQVQLVSGELGEDFTYYLAASEQIKSVVGVSVFVNDDNTIGSAGGFLIQLLPDTKEETIERLEKQIQEMPMVSKMMQDGMRPGEMLRTILGEEEIEIIDREPVKFECDCSKSRFAKGLISLGVTELESLQAEEEEVETVCHFCNNRYVFTKDEIGNLIAEIKGN